MSMLRRSFLGAGAAAAASSLAHARGKALRVGVVGGGIVGASIAMHLAQAGAKVTLFERTAPASGATLRSLAWINPVTTNPRYMQLRLASMRGWRKLDAALGMGVVWGGSISWTVGAAKGETLKTEADMLRGMDAPFRMLTPSDIKELSPAAIPNEPFSAAMYLPRDGHVDPVFATSRYLAAAKRYGATILYPCEVTAIDRRPGAPITVQTSRGPFTVDRLVTAGGVDTPHLMSLVDYKLGLLHAPGLAVRTTPQPIQTRMAYEAAGVIEFKQQANGQVAATYLAPPDLPVHAGIRAHPMDYPSEELRQFHGRMLIQKTAAFMPALAKAEPESVLIGFRPMPLDKLPVVGPVPGSDGVYVVVTHSGVTLSPILGQLVAGEVLTGAPAPSLAAFRPQRFV